MKTEQTQIIKTNRHLDNKAAINQEKETNENKKATHSNSGNS